MALTKQIISKSINATATAYVGKDGEVWADPVNNTLRIGDGTTAGGILLTGGGGGGATTWAAITDINNANGPGKVTIGRNAGSVNQGTQSIAIGNDAGKTSQSNTAVAIGESAGRENQAQSAVAIGTGAGTTNQGGAAIAIGNGTAVNDQGESAIAIGNLAVLAGQGDNAIAIGNRAGGFVNPQAATSIILNATGTQIENTTADSFVVKPIRNYPITTILGYNNATGEITYHTAIPGYTNTADLKALVAESTDFADFQTRIAAL